MTTTEIKARFYFTKEMLKRSKMYGNIIWRCHIYQIRENDGQPIKIAFVDYDSASTRGADSEVFAKLVEKEYIPKEYMEKSAYYYDSGVGKEYPIYEMRS
jgi:hypothetical protein